MQDLLTQAISYQNSYGIIGRAHYLAADRASRLDRLIGIPVVVITTIIGSALFGDLFSISTDIFLQTVSGILILLGALLAALQSLLSYEKLSSRHEAAALAYRDIARRYRTFTLRYTNATEEQRDEAANELARIDDRLLDIAQNSPRVSDRLYNIAKNESESQE